MDIPALIRAMYVAHCAECERAGVRAPTPEEWTDLVDAELRDLRQE